MNTITIELCAEDRARLDAILEALKQTPNCDSCVKSAIALVKDVPQEGRQEAQEQPKAEEPVNVPAEEEKPAESKIEATAPAPDRRTIKSLAVKKIQAGHRDEVKALIQAYGAEKIDLVPEDKLAAFVADLEQIGG